MNRQFNTLRAASALGLVLGAGSVMAGGFEKATTWSGKYSGIASSAVGHAIGAEALYFNPAGLVGSVEKTNISLNFSPTWGAYEGPLGIGPAGSPHKLKSKRTMSPVMGALASYKPVPKFGLGVGYFVSGGSAAHYTGLDFTNLGNVAFKPEMKTKLSLTEASIGAGFELIRGLRLGAAWRISMVNAEFCNPEIQPNIVLAEACLNDLSGSQMNGFRLGMQFVRASWGLGVNFRTPVKFKAEGKAAVRASAMPGMGGAAGGSPATSFVLGGDGQTASVASQFPLQVELGGYARVAPSTNVFWTYGYSQYSKNKKLAINIGTTSKDMDLNWRDQHHARLGVETKVDNVAYRVGYAITSAVTNASYAKPTFSSPGMGNVITAGAGFSVNSNLSLDFAGEYSFAEGKGSSPAPLGDYRTNSFTLHTGASYTF